jgi:hypothetical protein
LIFDVFHGNGSTFFLTQEITPVRKPDENGKPTTWSIPVENVDAPKQVYILKVTKIPDGKDDGVPVLSAEIKECVEGKSSISVVVNIYYM